MWISHFTFPALLIKLLPFPSVKDTPTALLAFAGALPDFTFFLLSLLGYEQIQYKPGTYKGCFRYDAVYPWSHSLIGQLGLGMGLGVLSSLVGGLRWGSIMPVVAAVVSHFVLDLPVHRKGEF